MKLFEPSKINGLQMSNRFIRSATWAGLADADGGCTPELVDLIVELAKGGIGLIITGHTYVTPAGQATPRQLGLYKDSLTEGLKEMTEAAHREGAKIILQLAHGGLMARSKLTGTAPQGPSTETGQDDDPGREMSVDEIGETVAAFGHAAGRAKAAGFDGVQIHAAHGYLLNQFLSPAFNRREDRYGGPIANRARLLLEVYQSIRHAVGRYYPVFIKINSDDFLTKGLILSDAIRIAILLDRAGADAIEVSGGTFVSGQLGPCRNKITFQRDQAYFRKAARLLRAAVKAPVILVGGIRSYLLAERLIVEGVADYISLCRPLIREPGLIKRWMLGDLRNATCISCNACFGPAMSGKGIYCVEDRKIETGSHYQEDSSSPGLFG
ncbi:MAG: NADH:flavin oxidoreductase [Desulfobacterales bacterium]